MWLRTELTRFLALLCALLFSSRALHADIALADSEYQGIRKELSAMRTQIAFLKSGLTEREAQSQELRDRLATLEMMLQDTVLKLENSERSLIQCMQDLGKIRIGLEALKKEYLALNQSLVRQKKETQAWKTVAIVSTVLTAIFGVATFAGR